MNPEPLASLSPVPELRQRLAGELAEDFPAGGNGVRLSRGPGRLDVMGGIADYTGSLVCEATLDRAAAVALRPRDDRQVRVFSFNLHDAHTPFTLQIPLESLAGSIDLLRREFAEPGRRWAGYMAGCLAILHDQKYVDLRRPDITGMNLAVLSTVPLGAGVSSSAAIEVATMINVCAHLQIKIDPLPLAQLCQQVENRVVGAPCGIMDQVTSCLGESGSLLRMVCQPHELLPPLHFPEGIRAIGINTNVKHSVAGGAYGKTRCAAFMAHRMILEKMRDIGRAAGRTLEGDPMNGYLANLDPDDYKRFFRPGLPEWMPGEVFLRAYEKTIDTATNVDPAINYPVQHAADHHVLEARRVKKFVTCLESAARQPLDSPLRKKELNKAGHLMYASHLSYTNDAMLGAPECDLLVDLVRKNEFQGLYGAKITGGGGGGTVAVLCGQTAQADAAIAQIMQEYQQKTAHPPEAFLGSSPGAWQTGSLLL